MPEDRPMTNQELKEKELESANKASLSLERFLAFPTDNNFMILKDKLAAYQFDWMNGRIRPS